MERDRNEPVHRYVVSDGLITATPEFNRGRTAMKPYTPRLITRQETLSADGWDLKRYSIRLPDSAIDQARFEEARRLALAA